MPQETSRRRLPVGLSILMALTLSLLSPSMATATGTQAATPSVALSRFAVVSVRVEGATGTIFEGNVLTSGHVVTTATGGTHLCDGTNGGANPHPGPTPTSALDDASRLAGFTWDGTFSTSFQDFFISRIADTSQTATQFWGILDNFQLIPVGGCQQEVGTHDQVLFAFDAFSKAHFLSMTGPSHARLGQPFSVRVTDGSTGLPISGANVGGQTTALDGTATITPAFLGLDRLKAERADSVRSNSLNVVVLP